MSSDIIDEHAYFLERSNYFKRKELLQSVDFSSQAKIFYQVTSCGCQEEEQSPHSRWLPDWFQGLESVSFCPKMITHCNKSEIVAGPSGWHHIASLKNGLEGSILIRVEEMLIWLDGVWGN